MNDETVSKYFFELSEAKNERMTKRIIVFSTFIITALFIVVLVLAVMLYRQNKRWSEFISDLEFVDETIDVASDGGNASYIGRDGSIVNGEDTDKKTDGTEKEWE